MKYFRSFTILVFLVVLSGCINGADNGAVNGPINGETSSPEEGYIFQIEGERVLILDNVEEADFGKSWNDLSEGYVGNAIWLKTSDAANLKVGNKVRYWVNGPVAESFPMQGSAGKIEVIAK